MNKVLAFFYILVAFVMVALSGCEKKEDNTVKVGILHSLSGTMAISETPVRDSELLAIKEINEAGGILGCQIKAVEEDGKSNPRMFAEKARKLIDQDGVATIFGCWTSDSRKAVKSVVEEKYNLLLDIFENRQLKQSMEYIKCNVILATVHGAKGLEWDYVFLPDLEQWVFPGYPTCIS